MVPNVLGTPAEWRRFLDEVIACYRPDELLFVDLCTAPADRARSYTLFAAAAAEVGVTAPRRLRAGDGVVVRTPLLPMTELVAWAACGDGGAMRDQLAALLARPEVDEAIFVASPALHAAIPRWRAAPGAAHVQGIEHALVKYVARMAGRATPFGLFSAISVGELGARSALTLAPRGAYWRRTRLDNDYLFALAGDLARAPGLRPRLRVRPSSSIYRIAGRLRYAAVRLDGQLRRYQLHAVEPTPYLDATLARAAGGATVEALARALVDEAAGITLADGLAYLDDLLDDQVLVPELGVHVTGPEPLDGMLAALAAMGATAEVAVLTATRAALAAIDGAPLGAPIAGYHAIAAALTALPTRVDLAQLFQVDLIKPARGTVGRRVAADIAGVIETLAGIVPRIVNRGLDAFRRAFRERWEDRVMPLAEVLDEESGIGFEAARGPGAAGAPLLAGLAFPAGAGPGGAAWGAAEQHLLRRLGVALARGDAEIALDADDLAAMKAAAPARLPDAFAALVRLARAATEPDGEAILFEAAAGPSGARLLGRFCHAAPAVEALVRAHHAAEEALRPDAIFAEIVHLTEGRVGNLLCRPVLRGHELVYLGLSGAPDDRQIRIEDLDVAVEGERIVLTSRRLGREIVPRLSTAHNLRARTLGVYRFLGALAGQGTDDIVWSWGVLGDALRLPRVRIGRVVVARATWNLAAADLAAITAAVRALTAAGKARPPVALEAARGEVRAAVAALRAIVHLPRFVVLALGDHELPIDLDSPLLVAAFADEIAGAERVVVRELFPAPDALVVHGPEGGYANEVLLTFVAGAPPERASPRAALVPTPGRRQFAPGSPWLYAKLYAGDATADRVLRDAIAPVVRDAVAAGDAHQWFFLRYADPRPQLRVRLAGDPARLAARVLPALERALAPLLASGAVHAWQLDTYERELERYGGAGAIELVEAMFWRDSEAVRAIVERLDRDAGADARWRLALRGADGMLAALGFDPTARAAIVGAARDGLAAEHRVGPGFWAPVGARYARDRGELEALVAGDPARDAAHALAPGLVILAARDAHLRPLGLALRRRAADGALTASLEQIAWSLVHMHANRILHASQRAQELVLCDLLRRVYAGQRARR